MSPDNILAAIVATDLVELAVNLCVDICPRPPIIGGGIQLFRVSVLGGGLKQMEGRGGREAVEICG